MRDIRGETLYFVFVDRFADGDPASNDGGNPLSHDVDKLDYSRYWGGDLQGVLDKLDYLRGIGVSAVVLSPVIEQMPSLGRDRGMLAAPYHGAWGADFRRLDPHIIARDQWGLAFSERGTVFDELVQACHARGMKLLLQFVCGHSNPGGPEYPRGQLRDDGRWLVSFEDDPQGWYRHGLGRDGSGRDGTETGAAAFDPSSIHYRSWLRSVLNDWLERGVDGFHFETANSLPAWFWQETTSALMSTRPEVLLIGGWNGRGWDDTTVAFANRSGMRVTDFGFQRHVVESLCWGDVGGFRRIAAYLDRDEQLEDATSLLTCLDHASVPRILSSGLRPEHLQMAVTLLMTARGVPWVFYGTEQGLRGDLEDSEEPYNRPMMDRFEDTAVTIAMRKLAALRKDNLAVQRGLHQTLWVNEDTYVFARRHAHDGIVVVLNRGRDTTIDLGDIPLPDGPIFDVLGSGGVIVRDKRVEKLHVPSGASMVFARTLQREAAGTLVLCRLSGYRSRFGESVVVTGNVPELGQWDLAKAKPLYYANAGLWMGDTTFGVSVGKPVLYKYAVVDQRGAVVREDRLPRCRVAPICCGMEWADRWGTDG
jgi:cyclomaltodextrin glucanotransferase